MALTDTAIRQAKPGDKPYKLYDRDGLFLLVNPGGSKLWRWRYHFEGKEKLMALGEYPIQVLSAAREQVLAGRKMVASGTDPMVERKVAKRGVAPSSFEAIAKQWWEWWSVGKAPRHAETVWKRLEGDVFPAYGHKDINAVTAADIREVMLVVDGRGAHDLARRVRETTSQIFRYAIAHGLAARNPAMDFQPGDILLDVKVAHQPRVEANELPSLLATIDGYTGADITRHAMRLMALTFVRTSELVKAAWSEFDLDRARWDIPGPRMKMKQPHIVPLARQTVAILIELRKITGGGKLLFPGAVDKDKSISTNTILFALYRLGYRGKMTGHGFRGIASTILHEHGRDHAHIELQLAHTEGSKVSAAYNFAQYLPQRAEMMQWWADHLDQQRARA